jgi:hypothetical protein
MPRDARQINSFQLDGKPAPLRREFDPRIHIRTKDDGAEYGGGAGCGNVSGYLDSWGTMTLPGSFEETAAYTLKYGFLCDGHGRATNGYTEESNLGLFTKVYEDEEGFQLEWAYDPKQKAQDARNTLAMRLSYEKTSGLSIGFFVGDGLTAPTGWTYDPDEDMPDGIDYICVMAQYFEEVLIKVSKPEYLKQNLERAKGQYCIYLFCRVHVFETSQTLVPANEVSLIAEVRDNSKQFMSTTRAKPEEDDDGPNQDDTMQSLSRCLRALTNEHREHDRITRDLHKEAAGHLAKLSGKSDEEDEKDPEEKPAKEKKEKPKKEEPEEEKKSRAQKLFEKGGKK